MHTCVKFVFYDLWVNGSFLYFFTNLKHIVGFPFGVRMKKKYLLQKIVTVIWFIVVTCFSVATWDCAIKLTLALEVWRDGVWGHFSATLALWLQASMQNISEAHRELSSFVKRPSESGRAPLTCEMFWKWREYIKNCSNFKVLVKSLFIAVFCLIARQVE